MKILNVEFLLHIFIPVVDSKYVIQKRKKLKVRTNFAVIVIIYLVTLLTQCPCIFHNFFDLFTNPIKVINEACVCVKIIPNWHWYTIFHNHKDINLPMLWVYGHLVSECDSDDTGTWAPVVLQAY